MVKKMKKQKPDASGYYGRLVSPDEKIMLARIDAVLKAGFFGKSPSASQLQKALHDIGYVIQADPGTALIVTGAPMPPLKMSMFTPTPPEAGSFSVPAPNVELFAWALEPAKVGDLIRVRFDRATNHAAIRSAAPLTADQIAQARKDVNADGKTLAGIGVERAAIAARVAVADAHAKTVAPRKPAANKSPPRDPAVQPRRRHAMGTKKR